MIAPRNRLLAWFAVIGLPFSVLAGTLPSTLAVCLLLIGAFVLLAVCDALLSRQALRGLTIDAPSVARLAIDRPGRLELRVHNPSLKTRALRLAIPMPSEFVTHQDAINLALPEGAEWSKFTWACVPEKRGRFVIDPAFLETSSSLGFWSIRRTLPLAAEVRVYPNLHRERNGLGLIFRGGAGTHAMRQVGKGREFEKLRDYVSGDSSEDIHWKATARRGRPVTKVFQIERTQEVYVAIDTSRLSARENAIERHITTALIIGLAAERQGDLFGLMAFSDRVDKFVRARNGTPHYHTCRDAIYALHPRPVNPDFDEVCSFIRLRLRRRALVILLTALDDPVLAENFLHNVDIIARQHLVVVGMMNPSGVAPLFSDPPVSETDELYERLGGHIRWHNLEEVGLQLRRRGVKLAVYDSEQMALRIVSDYLAIKKHQLL